jgi:hypothetical protein
MRAFRQDQELCQQVGPNHKFGSASKTAVSLMTDETANRRNSGGSKIALAGLQTRRPVRSSAVLE